MTGKPVKPPKHIPQRTCVGCRTVLPKRTLIRMVRNQDGVQVDPTGKLAGRGAYLHNRRTCWENGLRGPLAHALRATFTAEESQYLQQFMLSIPEDDEGTRAQA